MTATAIRPRGFWGERQEAMRSIVLSLLLMVLSVTGCATVHNTPAQDSAWERWTACDHFATIALERIDVDGRLVVAGYPHEVAPFTACMREATADQTRRGVAAGPQPNLFVKLFGCMGGAM